MYSAIVECCRKKPRYWMLAQLVQLQKLAESSGQVHQKGGETEDSGTSVTTVRVTISFYGSDGHYNVGYTLPVAFGISHNHSWYTAQGCIDPFANRTDDDVSIGSTGITGGVDATMRGQTDNQLEVTGSKSYDLPGSSPTHREHLDVTWDLRACKGQ